MDSVGILHSILVLIFSRDTEKPGVKVWKKLPYCERYKLLKNLFSKTKCNKYVKAEARLIQIGNKPYIFSSESDNSLE